MTVTMISCLLQGSCQHQKQWPGSTCPTLLPAFACTASDFRHKYKDLLTTTEGHKGDTRDISMLC